MKFLLAALLAAMTQSASAGTRAADGALSHTVSRLGSSTMTLSCGAGSPVACHYLILKSLCQERFLDDGAKERSCSYMEAVPAFHIQSGESKTVANLPSDFIYTMKPGRAPTVSECLAAPIPH